MKKKKYLTIGTIVILVLVIVGLVGYIFLNKDSKEDKKDQSTNNNTQVQETKSEFNMTVEEQMESKVAQYFDMNYLNLYEYDNLSRYPMAYQDTLIRFTAYVEKVIEEKDNKYKVLLEFPDQESSYNPKYIVMEGEYSNYRYLKNDYVLVYGVYKGNDTYNIDGKNEVLPKVSTIKVVVGQATGDFIEYDEEELRSVAKEFFGSTFTLTKPSYDPTTKLGIYLMGFPFHYILTLDNNTNARFNKYRIYPSGNRIDVATEEENEYLKRYISKASDNTNFILSTYTSNNDYLELQLYDKDFKNIWSREFKNAGGYCFDVNNNRVAISIDNEVYLIDEKTGEDIVDPIITSKGSTIQLLSNGDVILVTESAKDFIYYISNDGKIKWKTSLSTYNGESSNKIDGIYSILIANEKIYVGYYTNRFYTSNVVVFDTFGKELVNTFAHPKD